MMRTWFISFYAFACLSLGLLLDAQAQSPRLRLSADKTNAMAGETITVTLSLEDAPAFACWGAGLCLFSDQIGVDRQQAGFVPVHVPDSRALLVPDVRFGGYAFTNHTLGAYLLGRITVQANAQGDYILRAPSYDTNQPFGAILLSLEGDHIVPQADALTLAITGEVLCVTHLSKVDDVMHFEWRGGADGGTMYLECATNLIGEPAAWCIVTNTTPATKHIEGRIAGETRPWLFYRLRHE